MCPVGIKREKISKLVRLELDRANHKIKLVWLDAGQDRFVDLVALARRQGQARARHDPVLLLKHKLAVLRHGARARHQYVAAPYTHVKAPAPVGAGQSKIG